MAPITLDEWARFRLNDDGARAGHDVSLKCPLIYGETEEGKLADPAAYARSLEYFLAHRTAIQEAVLHSCLAFVRDFRAWNAHYGVPRDDLAHVNTVDDLAPMVQLEYVVLHPYHLDGLPYIGLDFECEWEKHGFLALLVGTNVLAAGYPGSAPAVDLSIRDDGGAIWP